MRRFFKIIIRTAFVLFVILHVITAFHAYKFTHFYEPAEVSAKKQADKSAWELTKEVFTGIKAVKKPGGTAPDSVYNNVTLVTKDGLKLEGWYTQVNEAKGTVCLFHGHGGNKSGVLAEAVSFQKMGFNTLMIDFRAHGYSQGNTCTIGYMESEDVKLAYDFVKSKNEKHIVLWGISMGAAAISKSVADYGLQPNRIILEMPFASLLQAAESRIKMMGLPAEPLAGLITFWGGLEHGFWAFSLKPENYVKKIECPVLLQWGAQDTRVSRTETAIIYKNIHTAKKLVIYENTGHASLCKNEHEKWQQQVQEFLK